MVAIWVPTWGDMRASQNGYSSHKVPSVPWGMERTRACRACGRPREADEIFSARGKCTDCARERVIDNAVQMVEGSGPFYDHWTRRSYMAARRRLLDAQQTSTQTARD